MDQARSYDMLGIHVWVSLVEPEIAKDGLGREHIRLEVEKRLVSAGLPIIQKLDGKQTPEFPCLGVILYVFQPQEDLAEYIFSIEMIFIHKIALAGPPVTDIMHMAWGREATGNVSKTAQGYNWSNLYEALDLLVDCFIKEFFSSQASVCQRTEARVSNHLRTYHQV